MPETLTIKSETRSLPCKLTDIELRQRADELALTIQEVNSEEDRQKNLKDQMKAKMSELQSRSTRLALVVSRREEYRDVEVTIEMREDGNMMETRRDTAEVLCIRPPRDFERQPRLNQ